MVSLPMYGEAPWDAAHHWQWHEDASNSLLPVVFSALAAWGWAGLPLSMGSFVAAPPPVLPAVMCQLPPQRIVLSQFIIVGIFRILDAHSP
eukprot:CAMPEP_0204143300 /NCGR_PEP_ID=MMETSP0361-20130328/20435_1 /ASSEMBLY_ACC=CAM_ASM_000343 /TAXON_ID=268821 /ORGANISM="Scrippsiella Hangoei, Strain SHTV-5" /LENGTH=90 /DNA_ID=CAMNT_0051097159 /DNA_START=1 /DNA_END=268 /DNA_ORIENTATION=-